jgi:acyl transferase domain-containing protein/thioesterase domain-containing protein
MRTNAEAQQLEGIAVIGMAGRFPGAPSLERFWQNLAGGLESVSTFSDAQLLSAGVHPDLLKSSHYVKAGVLLEGIDLFDADFFGFSPREAECTDPQQRLFLECAWEALEHAGYDPEQYTGQIGVFAGAGRSDYQNILASNPQLLSLLPNLLRSIAVEKDFLATRVSYKLNLKGPSLSVQTACSTSLVAVHLACQSLLSGESDMVLAGGVSIRVPQAAGYLYQEGSILSPDGHCRAFDAAAQGTVSGSGAGVVVLKRLADALSDGDTIHAVIRSTAINNDGAAKAGYTAPGVDGQATVVAEAQALAGVTADVISYVETHGIGTALGDPIEIEALTRAFRRTTQKNDFCAIGSLKTNIGHLDVAAGVASLIKVVLALEHKEIPPSLNFERPNPVIDFANSPFHVQRTASEWTTEGGRRLAGVSSFGIGGTNAHAVLEEAPGVVSSSVAVPWQLLTLSAKTAGALEKATDNLADFLASHPGANLQEVAFTLQKGRKAFAHRRALAAKDIKDAVHLLRSRDPKRVHTRKALEGQPGVVFLFPTQGAQHVNMGRGLYESEPLFRDEVDRCAAFLRGPLGVDLRGLLYPGPEDAEAASEQLNQTRFTQPAVFTIDYALARLWMSWGVMPGAMVGHGLGEYVAAAVAGVFELEDALKLVAERARLMQEQPPGSMLAVCLAETELTRWLSEDVSLAAVNAPGLCVVSGPVESIKRLNETFTAEQIKTRLLRTSRAFHSCMMAPVVSPFVAKVAQTPRRTPQIPVVSTLTGTWLTAAEALDPAYWGRQLRYSVRFSRAMQELLKTPRPLFLEVGPGDTLSVLAKLHLWGEAAQGAVLGSLRHAGETRPDRDFLRFTAGCLWAAGVPVAGEKLVGPENRRRVPLPTYPFDRKRYWIAPGRLEARESFEAAGLSPARPAAAYELSARSAEPPSPATDSPGAGVRVNGSRYARPELANKFVAPQTPTESRLAKLWEHLLGVTGIGIYDNFFDLGGQSLLAVMLVSEIVKRFGMRLPLASLIQAPTIHSFAQLVEAGQTKPSWSSLVPLNQEGAEPPLFLMHSHGGNVLEYYPLAHRLAKTRRVYALQARGLDGTLPDNLRIEEMAAYYLKELRTVQPAGPYYLGGYCLGGYLAIEAAQQLRAQNEKVSLVVLIDSSTRGYPTYLPGTNPVGRWFLRCTDRLAFEWSQWAGKPYGKKLAHALTRSRRFGDRARAKAEILLDKWPALQRSVFRKHSMTYYWELLARAHSRAWAAYQPKPYDGKVLFFRSQRQPKGIYPDPLLGWGETLTGEVTIHEIPGFRQTILSEPKVEIVASLVQKMMNGAGSSSLCTDVQTGTCQPSMQAADHWKAWSSLVAAQNMSQ